MNAVYVLAGVGAIKCKRLVYGPNVYVMFIPRARRRINVNVTYECARTVVLHAWVDYIHAYTTQCDGAYELFLIRLRLYLVPRFVREILP